MEHRAKPQNLVLVNPAPYGSHHVYHGPLPIEAALTARFFLPVRSNLRVGDTLQIQQTARIDGEERLLQFADTMVVAQSRDGVELCVKGSVIDVPLPDTDDDAARAIEIKWNLSARKHQALLGEQVLFESGDKDAVVAYVARQAA